MESQCFLDLIIGTGRAAAVQKDIKEAANKFSYLSRPQFVDWRLIQERACSERLFIKVQFSDQDALSESSSLACGTTQKTHSEFESPWPGSGWLQT